MSNETLGLIQLALLSLAIFIGFPTAFTLLALGFVFGSVGFGHLVFDMMVQRAFFVMSNDVLISIVLFVFMGYVVERSGILDRLFRTILVISGPLRGSLALSTVITCTIFAMATRIIGAAENNNPMKGNDPPLNPGAPPKNVTSDDRGTEKSAPDRARTHPEGTNRARGTPGWYERAGRVSPTALRHSP